MSPPAASAEVSRPVSRPRIRGTPGECVVEIDEDKSWDLQRLGAVLAHEAAHMLLAQRRVTVRGISLECLADAVAALSGFGALMLEARQRRHTTFLLVATVTETSTIGYLDAGDLRHLLRVHQLAVSESVFTWKSQWRPGAFLPCAACRSGLKLPEREGAFKVQCPTCRVHQSVQVADTLPWFNESRRRSDDSRL